MAFRLAVLASGSSGNSCLVEANGFRLLIDIGLGPRQLAARLAVTGVTWDNVDAVLLTHTHADHWKERTLELLLQKRISLYCHPKHVAKLLGQARKFSALDDAGLVRTYLGDAAVQFHERLVGWPLELCHDCEPTFGFRLEGLDNAAQPEWAVGYVADLGCWSAELAAALQDVDVLALEFNHDEKLERASGRSWNLIERVLGDHGHLSNNQAAMMLRTILTNSRPGTIRHLVQLHLSRDCNRPALAQASARMALKELAVEIPVHTANQDRVAPILTLETCRCPDRRWARGPVQLRRTAERAHPCLPGMDE